MLLFFMVSGFVLGLPFVRNRRAGGGPMPLWPYFRRRITRIEPPYLLVMTMLFVGATIAGAHIGLGRFLASLTYMYGSYYGSDPVLNSVAWSLEVEVQFYVLVPALALVLCVGLPLRSSDPAWIPRGQNGPGTVLQRIVAHPVAQSDALVVIPGLEEVPVPR